MMEFLPGVPASYVLERFAKAGGKEIESGKFASPMSSAFLAANTFGWFIPRPELLPALAGLEVGLPARRVEVEYSARFPWAGGSHPWLDAVVLTETHLVGIESKRYEPYRDRKEAALSEAYDRPVWGDRMRPFEEMRDALRSGVYRFELFDAAQLVKHAFGLVTDARRLGLKPVLVYLFAEPQFLNGREIDPARFAAHRAEVATFANAVQGAEVAFGATSYREWLAEWVATPATSEHGRAILEAFLP